MTYEITSSSSTSLTLETDKKLLNLRNLLSEMRSVLVTFSGGTDSAFLLKIAVEILGQRVLAVTAHSEIYKESELRAAVKLARVIGARHEIFNSSELSIESFRANPKDRCYHCKSHLFSEMRNIQKKHQLDYILDGTNHDDLTDFRPGMTAASEFGIRSPLKEVALTKAEIRQLSKQSGLSTWDKPAQPCLSSRFPYGARLTDEKLRRVEKAEAFLETLGLTQLRVRVHDDMARIETSPQGIQLLLAPENNQRVIDRLTELGYKQVTIDMRGYRSGSMNESLKQH